MTALPQGLSTNLGKELSQDGVRLSGGETQKLLLARALYRDPSIILLDEPTAALDALAESEIYEIYNRTLADITALFISHRLASTHFCEEILLLSDGRIAECGSHEELMEQKGKYYELFLVQSKYYGEELSDFPDERIQTAWCCNRGWSGLRRRYLLYQQHSLCEDH